MFEVFFSFLFLAFVIKQGWETFGPMIRFITSYLWKCDHKGKKGQDYIKDVPKGVWYYKCNSCLHELENGPL